ncbi:MAG: GHKL domain-containing protein [Lachnospiraceae bacterium]|nr:GHKL domain-containing protein [Lachnospiraceae bacterium]
MEREEEVLRVQTANLENRIRQNAEREELIQIARHDLRHQLTTIGSMLEQREYEQAKEYISTAVEPLQAVSVERYCANPILDIVFNSYFSRAKAKGICIEASLAVPKRLRVDDNELSVVLANALENAIHACAKLPEGRRVIRCRCVARPQLMFQISNPFDGEVEFDKQGRPVSKEPGHGIGTRSIHSFCERNNGFADYKVKDGWFYLRIVLPE